MTSFQPVDAGAADASWWYARAARLERAGPDGGGATGRTAAAALLATGAPGAVMAEFGRTGAPGRGLIAPIRLTGP